MTGPPVRFPQLQNARATANLLETLGITAPIRFDVIPSVLPVAILSTVDPTREEKLAYGKAVQAAVVAENAHVQLFNPNNSGVIVHVDSIMVANGANATVCFIAEHDVALTTNVTTLGYRDRRLAGAPVAQIRRLSTGSTLGNDRLSMRLSVQETILIPLDTYLGPGQGILVVLATTDTEVQASYYWEEIPPVGTG